MAEQPIGPVLDGLGITLDLDDDGDLIDSALVIAKVVDSDGEVSLYLAGSTGLSWIDRAGLLAAAQNITTQMPIQQAGDDT